VAHFQAMVEDIRQFFAVSKVFVTGLSNGSMMAYRLACDIPGQLAGVACLSGTMLRDENTPSGPVPIIHIHGTADKNAPYDGGYGQLAWVPINHRSVQENTAIWVNNNGCEADPEIETRDNSIIATYKAVGTSADYRLIKVFGLGHGWSGGTHMLSAYIEGDIGHNIDACTEIFDFFEGQK